MSNIFVLDQVSAEFQESLDKFLDRKYKERDVNVYLASEYEGEVGLQDLERMDEIWLCLDEDTSQVGRILTLSRFLRKEIYHFASKTSLSNTVGKGDREQFAYFRTKLEKRMVQYLIILFIESLLLLTLSVCMFEVSKSPLDWFLLPLAFAGAFGVLYPIVCSALYLD